MEQLNFFTHNEPEKNRIICTEPDVLKLYTDGASRNNPGPSAVGFCLKSGETVICEQGFYIGNKTNNQAEYMALLVGIFFAKEFVKPADKIAVFSDSQLLVRQMNKQYKVKDVQLQKFQMIAYELLCGYTYSFCHIYRKDNMRADELANRGLDKKIPLPKKFLDLLSQYA